jgi:hypothetical protein
MNPSLALRAGAFLLGDKEDGGKTLSAIDSKIVFAMMRQADHHREGRSHAIIFARRAIMLVVPCRVWRESHAGTVSGTVGGSAGY